MGSGIDIVIDIFKLLYVPAVTNLLDGDVWQHNRPRNSQLTDVVISIPEYNYGKINSGFIDIDVHSPNLKDFYPITGEPEDGTFPDLGKFKPLVDVILSLIVSTSSYSLSTKIAGIPIRDKDGEWYVNIRIEFEAINTSEAVDVDLLKEVSAPDGYGGVLVSDEIIWSGKASQINIKKGSQLNVNAGRFEFNLVSDWVLPLEVTPQKNNRIKTLEGDYVINGIVRNSGFWQLSTIRKDGEN